MTQPSHFALIEQSIGRFTFEHGDAVDDAGFSYAIVHPDRPPAGLIIVCPSLTGDPTILWDWWQGVAPADAIASYITLFPHAFTAATVDALPPAGVPGIRDLARGIMALVQTLGLPHPTFVTGGSLGGMLALETGLEAGDPAHALVLAAPAVQTAWGAGWNAIQLQGLALGGPEHGMMLARAIGMMTYRTEREFEARFGADAVRDGRTIHGYLRHHGEKLLARMDVREYERRVRAMDGHDVGRGRGGWKAAIAPHSARITAVGIVGDSLYSADIVRDWARASGAHYREVASIHGHDAFLLETPQMRAVIADAFARAAAQQPVGAAPAVR